MVGGNSKTVSLCNGKLIGRGGVDGFGEQNRSSARML